MTDARALGAARPRELEDPLNFHVYHPLAWRLASALARTSATPNMVSVVGGLSVVAAGVAYAGPLWGFAWPASAGLGMALHLAWHVIDGADGDLARMTGRSSPRGEMVDGLCDYLSHIVLYALLAALLSREIGGAAWFVATAAGVAHAFQANHVETQRRFYLHWVYGKPWLANAAPDVSGPFAWLVALYLRFGVGLSPHAPAIDRAVTAAADDPARLEKLRSLVRAEWAPLIALEKWLGPNQRAIALGTSMLVTQSPLAYFAFGGVWLTALLAVSVVAHDRAARRLAARIASLG
ncbi:MAG TPA: CDP-alcohol phosphatidyltransferase family protein [Novosphingobium sp.]|nr:CDP-alcohol phosphatidyltransferase family protein [Novosphingobium sp.]